MKRVVALAALVLALGLGVGEARAADECRGLQTCLPVEGPWVAIPAPQGDGSATAVWQLKCPLRGYIVAGIDARVSDRTIDVSIRGESGAPVGPGVTTGAEVLFTAVYTGGAPMRTAFRPYIGCIPTSGGGARGETAVRRLAAFVPAKPLDRRVVERGLVAGGTVRVVSRCPTGTRLLGSDASYGFRVPQEPGASLLDAVRVRRTVAGRTVTAVATVAAAFPQRVPVRLQVHALCTKVTR